MCGICGVISINEAQPVDRDVLHRMNQTLRHRGPDDEGYYQDSQAALAMRRLSIIDLNTGHQPISNETGEIWVVYNGEIYNFREVRAELEHRGHIFKTLTDTEVIVHAYEEYGDDCIKHFNGMFAIALWDARKHRLLMVRDRIGVKPLYFYLGDRQLVFGSELKSVIANPHVPRRIDLCALDLFLTLEYIPGPRTIYQDIQKLMPGHMLTIENGQVKITQYWEIPNKPILLGEDDCIAALSGLIKDAVRIRLMSDVPLGAFLSGGIDSSTIVGFMSQLNGSPIQTFSIGFEDDTYNELPFARAVARHFNTKHRDEVLQPDIVQLAEELVQHQDEPFADTSMFPTYLVSKLASREVKVVLSGDGGDEIFAGYDSYLAQKLDRFYGILPEQLRRKVLPELASWLPPQPAKKGLINKIKRMVEGGAYDPALQHTRWMIFLGPNEKRSLYEGTFAEMAQAKSVELLFGQYFSKAAVFDSLTQQQFVDVKTYLADDILTKVDRMSMAVSVEARVPLLDYRIVEFAMNLPASMKLNRSQTKAILRRAVKGLIPDAVLDKPKQGFSIPMKHWLGTSLKPMMMDLLSEDALRKQGYFNPAVVSTWVKEHLSGRVNHSHRLWSLMVYQIWERNQ